MLFRKGLLKAWQPKRGFWVSILNSWLWKPSKHRKSNFDIFKKWRNNIFCSNPKNGVLTDLVLKKPPMKFSIFCFVCLSKCGRKYIETWEHLVLFCVIALFFSVTYLKEQTNKTRSDWLKNSYKQKIVETKIRSEFWNRSCISIPLLSYCKIRGWMYPSLKKEKELILHVNHLYLQTFFYH